MADKTPTLNNWRPEGEDRLRGNLVGGKPRDGTVVVTQPVKAMPAKSANSVELADGQKLALGEPYKAKGEPKPETAGAAKN